MFLRCVMFLAFSFLSGHMVLANCVIPTASQSVQIQSGQALSLFDAQGSLANFRTQDQDGIGSCYANASSVLLQSVLPGNPSLSYLHIALMANSKTGSGPASLVSQNSNRRLEIDGGSICEAVADVRERGGACMRESSLLESNSFPAPMQAELLTRLSEHINTYRTLTEQQRQDYNQQLGVFLDAVTQARDAGVELDKNQLPEINSVNSTAATYCSSLTTCHTSSIVNTLTRAGITRENIQLILTSTNSASPIMEAIMPDCLQENSRVRLPENLSCRQTTLCRTSNYDYDGCVRRNSVEECNAGRESYNNLQASRERGNAARNIFQVYPAESSQECLSLQQAKSQLSQSVYSDIRSGRAVGISLCSAFLTNQAGINTNYCRGENNGGGHAVAVTGYRCVGDQLQYQIQNSWGTTCPNTANQAGSGIECEYQSDGRSTGRIWIQEEMLINNMRSFEQLYVP